MGFDDTRRAIETYFRANYTATALYFDGEPRPSRAGDPPLEWVALSIKEGDGQQKSTGSASGTARHGYVGVVMVQVFTPKSAGSARGRVIADVVSGLLRRRTLSYGTSGSITLRTPSADPIGEDPGGWWHTNVVIPFRRSVHF